MVEKVTVRMSSKLRKAIEQDAKQKGFSSLNEYYEKAFEHFLTCNKFEPSMKLREWILNYDDTCRMCKRKVKAGEWALWGKDAMGNSIVICMDCYITRVGDKGIVAKYMKLREWDYTLKSIKKQCEAYAQRHENYQLLERVREADKEKTELDKLIWDYLTHHVGSEKEQEKWEEFVRKSEEWIKLMHEIREFLEKLKARRKKGVPIIA